MEMSMPGHADMAPRPSANTNSAGAPPAPFRSPSPPPSRTAGEEEEAASRIFHLKFVNATSFLLTSVMVVGVVLLGAREEGVFGDEFLWMKYQTLLTPSTWVNLIWIPVFVLQGLFVYASTLHETLQRSPLVGYAAAVNSPTRSVAVHYPLACASTLVMVYAHDSGRVGIAFLASLACGAVLARVLKMQDESLLRMEEEEARGGVNSHSSLRTASSRYLALRLPFELHAGHVLASAGVYLNASLGGFDGAPAAAFLTAAGATLAALLCAGFQLLWRTERKFYGVAAALVWYLLGVAAELRSPTQPIYNEFSDDAILATQAAAGAAALVLATSLGVRVVKTVIKRDVPGRAEPGEGDAGAAEEGGIGTGYARA